MGALFYNTNGFAFHRLEDAARILAELGYDGIALTPDVHHLDPLRCTAKDVASFRSLLDDLGLDVVIETGARFVLDARRKHRPTLLDAAPEARRRFAFLCRCIDLARELGARTVTVWSGRAPHGASPEDVRRRLVDGLRRLCDYGAERGVRIGFEPEPGMEIEQARQWPALRDDVGHPALGLTLDVGHCVATGEGDPAAVVRTHANDLVVLHLDDHEPGLHEHRAFGEGVVDFTGLARAIHEIGYGGPLEVELSRHAATAPATARESLEFLRSAFEQARREVGGLP